MKKLVLFLVWIFFVISCESPEKESTDPLPKPVHIGFGALDGVLWFKNESNPLQGYTINVGSKDSVITDVKGHFYFSRLPEGVQTIKVSLNSETRWKLVCSTGVSIQSDKTVQVQIPLTYLKGELPEFTAIDLSQEGIVDIQNRSWGYMIAGIDQSFFFHGENSLPTYAIYHYKNGKDYGITFDERGFPKQLSAGDFIVRYGNFTATTVDIGILIPTGETQIIRGIPVDFSWAKSAKSIQSRADVIRWTGRVLGALPCIAEGAAAIVAGGTIVPLDLLAAWTCGNYFVKMADNFFEDADVENGFTKFVDDYKLNSTMYACAENPSDPTTCLVNLASKGLNSYADYVAEMDSKEEYLTKLQQRVDNNVPLKQIILQPGPEGKDAWINLSSVSDPCREFYAHSGSDSVISVIYDTWGTCSNEVDRMLIQFPAQFIPITAVVASATLELYGYGTINQHNSSPGFSIAAIKDSWGEDNVSWENQPETEFIESIEFPAGDNAWHSWDVTYTVQKWVDGTEQNYGLEIYPSKNYVYGYFFSGDHPNATKRPKLTISYY
jgi:hypothetical protein